MTHILWMLFWQRLIGLYGMKAVDRHEARLRAGFEKRLGAEGEKNITE